MKIKSIATILLSSLLLSNIQINAEQETTKTEQAVIKFEQEPVNVNLKNLTQNSDNTQTYLIIGAAGVATLAIFSAGTWYFTKLSKEKEIEAKNKIIADKDKEITKKENFVKFLQTLRQAKEVTYNGDFGETYKRVSKNKNLFIQDINWKFKQGSLPEQQTQTQNQAFQEYLVLADLYEKFLNS